MSADAENDVYVGKAAVLLRIISVLTQIYFLYA